MLNRRSGPPGRLVVVLPNMVLLVSHPRIQRQSLRFKSPAGLLGLWYCLAPDARQRLLAAGIKEQQFTASLIRDYERIWRRVCIRNQEGTAQ